MQYYGRSVVVPRDDPIFSSALSSITTLQDVTSKLAKNSPLAVGWRQIDDDLCKVVDMLMSRDVEMYKVNMLTSLASYIEEIVGRHGKPIDPSRFHQVHQLLSTLYEDNDSGGSEAKHPARTLQRLDCLLAEIKLSSRFNFTPSSLLLKLDAAVSKEWKPIMQTTQRALNSVGSKLLFLGLVETIGRPLVTLYPIYLVASKALEIVARMEGRGFGEGFRAKDVADLTKALLLLYACSKLMGILQMYSGVGSACLLVGAAALAAASSAEITKTSAPLLAPYLYRVEQMVNHVAAAEDRVMGAISSSPVGGAVPTAVPVSGGTGDAVMADEVVYTSGSGLRRRG